MASRLLSDLHPKLEPLARLFLEICKSKGIDILITCTYRSGREQDALYAQGRTTEGKIVTNAQAGESAHNYTIAGKPAAKAFDIVPLIAGKCCWDSKNDVWQEVGDIGKSIGLEWAGDWKKFKEYPHFQLKDWRSV